MDDFVVIDDVPVFDEFDEYTPEVLQVIIDNCNQRIADTGDAAPLVIGHTDPNQPEIKQPLVVGYATNFRLGEIGAVNPRKAIVATFRFFRDKWEIAKNFPRRSVELWKKELFLDPISLLGPTTPARDLTLVYEKKGEKEVREFENHNDRYSQGASMDKEEILKEVMSMVSKCAEFEYVRKQMKDSEKEAKEDEPDTEEPVEKEAEEEVEADDGKEKDRMQKDQLKTQVERFRREAEVTKASLQELQRKFRRTERERDLIRLEAQGICFDLAEEVEMVQDLSPEQYSKHLAHMEKRYQKAPFGVDIKPVAQPDFGSEKFNKKDMEAAVSVAQKEGVSFEQAMKQVKQGV